MITRRTALLSIASLLAAPLAAEAQQQSAGQVTIGVLATTQLTEPVRRAIRAGLQEHGYTEGRNLAIEWRSAEDHRDRLAGLATELARLKVDVIIALLTPAVQAAKNATSTIPIIMAPAGDPVASGFVARLARPGRNLTGVTGIGPELSGKQIEALRQVFPRLTRLALLLSPAGETLSTAFRAQTEAAAKTAVSTFMSSAWQMRKNLNEHLRRSRIITMKA